MQKGIVNIDLTATGTEVRTLAGSMASYSTEVLHTRGHHQLLRIDSGVTLLVDEQRRQPMFGALTAFIPADFAHRSVVLGSPVHYKSIYLASALVPSAAKEIRLFSSVLWVRPCLTASISGVPRAWIAASTGNASICC